MSKRNFIDRFIKNDIPHTPSIRLNSVLRDYADKCIKYNISESSIRLELAFFIDFNHEVYDIISRL